MRTTQEIINLLKDFKAKQASKYGIRRMGVFGSVARGEQHENSDVDVYIEGELQGLFALAGIKNELEELLGCQVDIVRLQRSDGYFSSKKEYRRRASMFDQEETLHLLELIESTLSIIEERCKEIVTVDDFLLSDQGMILMDSVCMKVIAVGESVKNAG